MGNVCLCSAGNLLPALLLGWALTLAPLWEAQAQYVHTFGSAGFDEGVAVGFDAAGNTYVTGVFAGTVDFDPGPGTASLTSVHRDVFVASYDAAGAFRFAFQLGNAFATAEEAGSIAVDDAGSFVVTGSQPFSAIDYDPDPNATQERTGKLFIARYDAGGGFLFAVAPSGISPSSFGKGNAVTLDAAGHVYVTGQFTDGLVFPRAAGAPDSLTSAGSTDIFVASFTAEGTSRFAFRLGGPGADAGFGIAADGAGHIYVTGQFRDTVAFDPDDTDGNGDPEHRTASGNTDLFIASYTAAGVFRFAYALGNTGGDAGYSLAVDAADNLYLTGQFSGPVAFDPDDADGNGDVAQRTGAANGSAFVASYTASGALRFVSVPPGGSSAGRSVVTDASGVSFVTGSFAGTVDFDPGPGTDTLAAEAGTDVFVASYRGTGAYRLAFALGGAHLNGGNGIAVDAANNVALTGAFYGTTDFDPGTGVDARTSAGQSDLFIARYPAELLVAAEPDPAEHPDRLQLSKAYPNPFQGQTRFTLTLRAPQHVRIAVYDVLGRRTMLLHDGALAAVETHHFTFDGAGLAAGLYLLRIDGERFQETLGVVLRR
jgi:hypothetical protein